MFSELKEITMGLRVHVSTSFKLSTLTFSQPLEDPLFMIFSRVPLTPQPFPLQFTTEWYQT